MINTYTEPIAAWFAGAIDGDGSIAIYRSTDGRRACIRLFSTCRPFVEKARELAGFGSIHFTSYKHPAHKGRKPVYVWDGKGSRRCYPLIKAMLPWLVVKRERAEAIIEELENRPFGRWLHLGAKEAHSEMMRARWANPKERQRLLTKIQLTWTPERRAAHSAVLKAHYANRKAQS